jgi:plastocyanin
MAFYKDDSAKDEIYFGRDLLTVGETTYVFKVPGPGEYFYRCEFHPTQMTGTLKVEEPAHES